MSLVRKLIHPSIVRFLIGAQKEAPALASIEIIHIMRELRRRAQQLLLLHFCKLFDVLKQLCLHLFDLVLV